MKGTDTLQKVFYKTGGFLKRKSPTILTCAGVVGVVTTTAFTIKGTVKAVELLNQAEEAKGEELTAQEMVKVLLPPYIPAIISGVATITCIVGANVINKRHQASLISAYSVIDQAFKEYRNKVEELHPRR